MKKEKYFRLNKEETEALAQEYGTPLLVLSLEQIEKNYRLLRTHLPRAVDDLKNIGAYWRRNITPDEADRITGKILRDLKELKLFYPAADSIKYEPLKSRNFRILKSQNYICICKKVEHIIYVYHIAHLPTEYPDIF